MRKILFIASFPIAGLLLFCLGYNYHKPKTITIEKEIYINKPISWWFKDNVLYWAFDGKYNPFNYMEFQLDKQIPPTINYEPIQRIKVLNNTVMVFTKDKYWLLHYAGTLEDWYVEDYQNILYNKERK